MKKIFGLILGLLLSIFVVSPALAKVMVQEKGTLNIPAEEVIDDDLFIGAESVNIAGTINGDIYVGAGTVNFSGQVLGDLVVGAGTVTISQAIIGDTLIVGAGTVTIDEDSLIGGSLIAGTGTLNNDAPIGRNLMIGGGTISLNAPVGGEVMMAGGNLTLGPNTMIEGDLTYAAESLNQDELVTIGGKVTKYDAPKDWDRKETPRKMAAFGLAGKAGLTVLSYLSALIVGLVLLWLMPKHAQGIADTIHSKFVPSLGWGFLLLLVTPLALLLMAITGIGFPLAMILGVLFAIDLYVAKLFVALVIGKYLSQHLGWKKLSLQATFAIGLALYYALRFIPVVGFFGCLVTLLSGLGGVWLYKKQLFAKK